MISKFFLNHLNIFFLTVGQNNFDNKIPFWQMQKLQPKKPTKHAGVIYEWSHSLGSPTSGSWVPDQIFTSGHRFFGRVWTCRSCHSSCLDRPRKTVEGWKGQNTLSKIPISSWFWPGNNCRSYLKHLSNDKFLCFEEKTFQQYVRAHHMLSRILNFLFVQLFLKVTMSNLFVTSKNEFSNSRI